MKRNKAQSAIEYILLAACVIAFLIVFLAPGGLMHNTIGTNVNSAVDMIGMMAQSTNFQSGQYPTGGGGGGGTPVNCNDYDETTCSAPDCMWKTTYGGNPCHETSTKCVALNPAQCSKLMGSLCCYAVGSCSSYCP